MANNNQYTMLDSFEIIGTWFLPHQKKEDGVKGTLKYSPHSIKLELNGIFEDESPFDQKNGILILGYTNTGEGVSLHNCSTIGISLGGYFTKSYIAELFFM
ncbi:hypothetical protein LJC08_06145, partial [Methanimicrococcus sp. OttesenSCG-928-J09]|nr:hypothetical protein [Methanimicrococcus sp. OttesenSCG-928-J09]